MLAGVSGMYRFNKTIWKLTEMKRKHFWSYYTQNHYLSWGLWGRSQSGFSMLKTPNLGQSARLREKGSTKPPINLLRKGHDLHQETLKAPFLSFQLKNRPPYPKSIACRVLKYFPCCYINRVPSLNSSVTKPVEASEQEEDNRV